MAVVQQEKKETRPIAKAGGKEEVPLKGTFVHVMLMGVFLVIVWVGMFALFLWRS